jgi:hypothetical protein
MTFGLVAGMVLSVFAQPLDRILAVVNGHVIMRSDVRAFLDLGLVDGTSSPADEGTVLTLLIERRVVLDEVDRFVVEEPDPVVVEQRLARLRADLPRGTELEPLLARSGLTLDDLRYLLADDIRREMYLQRRFQVVGDDRDEAVRDWVGNLLTRAQIRRSR